MHTAAATCATDTVRFEPPGPGSWMLDTTHHGRRPLTRYMQPRSADAFAADFLTMAEDYGLPLAEARPALVHGCTYVRLLGLGEPEAPTRKPPAPAL